MTRGSETVGLVLVHGVGEQKRFDHLTAEVRHLVAALEALPYTRVSVQTSATQDSGVGASRESWRADDVAPITIHVETGPDAKKICLCLHEVWWADLDDKETLWNRLKFWFWGLGFWWVREYSEPILEGASRDMQPPEFPPFRLGGERGRRVLARARLWCFANVFLLSAVSVNVLNFALRKLRLGQVPGGDVFYQFVGDVKLYQDRGRASQGPLTDLGEPRRVAIRRRFVRVLVDAYRARYDRWYILAHSLGTVVAWNGLMETEHALPNYLDNNVWEDLKATNDPVLGPRKDGKKRSVSDMMPSRPVWIDDDEQVLYREKLFERLHGFVTYGSPLDKFAYLWKQIVNINKDTFVWHRDFEWVNVFEHTDPVSSPLAAFSGAIPKDTPQPRNLAYKASRKLLLSHLQYLHLRGNRNGMPPGDLFVMRLVSWVLDGKRPFPSPGPADAHWYQNSKASHGFLLRAPMWLLATLALVWAIAYLGVPALLNILAWLAGLELLEWIGLAAYFNDLQLRFSDLSLAERAIGILITSSVIVTICGIVGRILHALRIGKRTDAYGSAHPQLKSA